MSGLHEQERDADGVLRCTCQRKAAVSDDAQQLVGTLEAWRHNAALHNAMRREIERVATYAASHERTHEWISDRLIEILDDPKAWMEPGPRIFELPAEPGPEVTAVRDGMGDVWVRADDDCWRWTGAGAGTRSHLLWVELLARGPLTDASAEATP